MPYPPAIDDAVMFPPPPPVAVVQACPLHLNTCGIETLTLAAHPSAPVSFAAAPSAVLSPGADGRFVFAPGVETFQLSWTLSGHAHVEILRLELYNRDSALEIWSKTLDYTGGGISANGNTAFNGNIDVTVNTTSVPPSTVTVLAPGALGFPRNVLSVEHAPYKLVLRIAQVVANTEVTCAARWVYLDVLVHDLQLELGPAAWIPPAVGGYASSRKYALVVATHADIENQLGGVGRTLGATAPADLRVRLTANVFAKSSDDFYSNTVFAGLQGLWGDGPTLPLVATLRVRQSDGTPAGAQAGAAALGNVSVLWDWVGGTRPVHPNERARNFITDAVGYKPRDWPQASSNCHADHGGKRGPMVPPHFQALPVGALPVPALNVVPGAQRPWAALSKPVNDPGSIDGGRAGVLFVPSRIAGDTYRLRVYVAYPTAAMFDFAGALDGIAAGSIGVVSPSTWTVWRRVDVTTQWRKSAAIDVAALAWNNVEARFADACVELSRPPATQDIAAGQYQAAFSRIAPALTRVVQLALDLPANQYANDYGVHFRTYANFCAAVDTHFTGLAAYFGPRLPFRSDDAFLRAQLVHATLPIDDCFHEDLLLPTQADLAHPAAELRSRALTAIGIIDADSYAAKCKSWADDVLTKVCGEHVRAVSIGQPGLHVYHFEFIDNWFHQNDVAEAATSVSNRAVCPSCNSATVAQPPRLNWPKRNCAANRLCGTCGFRLDDSALVVSYVPLRYMNGAFDEWARDNLSRLQGGMILTGRLTGTTAAISIAHEIGHQLGMPHAGPDAHLGPITVKRTGGVYSRFHDADDNACIMSYNVMQAPHLHFCGVCSLRLAGWSIGPSEAVTRPLDNMVDVNTVPLSNRVGFNQARTPPPGAAVNPALACATCHAVFDRFRPRQHCRLCGGAFCDAHSRGKRPVRNPLPRNVVTNQTVCDTCFALGGLALSPNVGAVWQPDENAYSCAHVDCNTRFSTFKRKHHCRACGQIFCSLHTTHRRDVIDALTEQGPTSMERVCDACNQLYLSAE